jgi:sulfatase maturation enzyme AslB (radical SAM superfamily)
MVKSRQYNLLAGDFLSGWQEMGQIRALKAPPHYRCNHCEKKALCGYCPAFFELETGAADVASKYLCAMGHLRFEALNTTL